MLKIISLVSEKDLEWYYNGITPYACPSRRRPLFPIRWEDAPGITMVLLCIHALLGGGYLFKHFWQLAVAVWCAFITVYQLVWLLILPLPTVKTI